LDLLVLVRVWSIAVMVVQEYKAPSGYVPGNGLVAVKCFLNEKLAKIHDFTRLNP
jgi:hypothetical protein